MVPVCWYLYKSLRVYTSINKPSACPSLDYVRDVIKAGSVPLSVLLSHLHSTSYPQST
jgi:hypothetical protein